MGQCADLNRDSFYSWFTLTYIATGGGVVSPADDRKEHVSWSRPCAVRRRSTRLHVPGPVHLSTGHLLPFVCHGRIVPVELGTKICQAVH